MNRVLGPMRRLPEFLDGRRVGFVSEQFRNRYTWIRPRLARQIVFNSAKHIGMAVNVWKDTDSDIFFIFEHRPDYSLFLYAVLLLKRKPVFFFVHEIQQVASLKVRSRLALRLCQLWVKLGDIHPVFIALGDEGLPASFRFPQERSLVVPHPHPLAEATFPVRRKQPASAMSPIRIGFIESTRKEKPVRPLFEALQRARDKLGAQLMVGSPLRNRPAWLQGLDVEFVDTSTEAGFSDFLAGIDIFAADFLKAEYYFRPSGVLVDAGMRGCYIICPSFPVFRAQVARPVTIGATFEDRGEIPGLIQEAMARLEAGSVDFEAWRNHHRIAGIAAMLKKHLQKGDESAFSPSKRGDAP